MRSRVAGVFFRNRLNADRGVVLPILEADIADRNDFFEGKVLAALGDAYEDDATNAVRHLSGTGDELDRYGLSYTIIGEDLCRSVLDAGLPGDVGDKVAAFVTKNLAALDRTQHTPVRCWLIASGYVRQDKFAYAKDFYDRGIQKLEKNPKSDFDNPLIGDAAQRAAYAERRVWIVETKKKTARVDPSFLRPWWPDAPARLSRPGLVGLP